jgi:hypothetical protein
MFPPIEKEVSRSQNASFCCTPSNNNLISDQQQEEASFLSNYLPKATMIILKHVWKSVSCPH